MLWNDNKSKQSWKNKRKNVMKYHEAPFSLPLPTALRFARLLDPKDHYFHSRIITEDGTPACCLDTKSLYDIPGLDHLFLIVDDNSAVWPSHRGN